MKLRFKDRIVKTDEDIFIAKPFEFLSASENLV
jgi:hypothetical protein